MFLMRLTKAAADHERMAAFFARIGKARAAAREIRKAEALKKAHQIRRETKGSKKCQQQ